MPRVPEPQGPSVLSGPLPGAYQSSIASPDLLGAAGRQAEQTGNAMVGAGNDFARSYAERAEQANALRVDDALNQATEAALRLQHDPKEGFKSQTGYDAVNRQSGQPLADEYTDKLTKVVGDISGTLGNDRQRQMFAMKANNVVTQFRGQAMSYEGQQYKDYNLSVRDATVDGAKNALALNFLDPNNVATQTTRIRAAIEGGQDPNGTFIPGSAQMQGKSAAWAREKSAEAISAAHTMAVKSALEQGNVNAAMAYVKKYGPEMTAADALQVQGTLTRDYDARQGMTVANQVFETVKPAVQPTDFDRLTQLVAGAESGNRDRNADGTVVTSPTGAKGRMQVLDSTNGNPGFGVTPAKDDSLEERARVGRDYLGAMVKRYGGDVEKALAAYNWGPGNVDDAVKNAGEGMRTGSDWRSYLPAETKAYVAGITAKYQTGVGTPPKPTLAELHEAVRARLGPTASPLAIKTATETVTQRFNDAEAAQKQQGDEAVANAFRALAANGGKVSELPTSVRDAVSRYAPDKTDDLFKFGKRVAEGDDSTNPAVYLKMTDPRTLTALSDNEFYQLRGQLSNDDFKHFTNERQKLLSGQGGNSPQDLNTSAIKETLDQRLRELKIDPTPKDDGKDDAARIGAIRRFVDTSILARQRDLGKKMTDAEVRQHIDLIFAQPAQLSGWLGTYNAPAISAPVGDLPSATRDAIKASFKKLGVDSPTDAQVLHAWYNLSINKRNGR